MQQQWTISQSDSDMWWKVDFIQPPMMTSSVVGQRRSSKALPKGKLAPKKDHGHCLGVCCGQSLVVSLIHYSCLNLGETITSEKYSQQIDKIHWKLQNLKPALVNRMSPILFHSHTWLHVAQPMLEKLNELGFSVLPHLAYASDLWSTDHHFKHLDNFLQGKCFHDQQDAKNTFQEFVNPEAQIFTLQE